MARHLWKNQIVPSAFMDSILPGQEGFKVEEDLLGLDALLLQRYPILQQLLLPLDRASVWAAQENRN